MAPFVGYGWPGEWPLGLVVEGPAGRLRLFQTVPDPTRVKNRAHLDLTTADLDAKVQRLLD